MSQLLTTSSQAPTRRTQRASSKESVSSTSTVRPAEQCIDGAGPSPPSATSTYQRVNPQPTEQSVAPSQPHPDLSFIHSASFRPRFRFPPEVDFAIADVQYKITGRLFEWLIPLPSHRPPQIDLLHSMLHLWGQKRKLIRRALGTRYDTIDSIFQAWTSERTVVANLSSRFVALSDLPPTLDTAMERMHILNTLRAEKVMMLQICPDETLRTESLVKALGLLTDTDGADSMFAYGISRLQRDDMYMLGMMDP